MTNTAIIRGTFQDEIRRNKDRARKTMKQLKGSKALGGEGNNTGGSSPQRTKAGGMTATAGGFSTIGQSPIDYLLFSNMRGGQSGGLMGSSLGNTLNSSSSATQSVIGPLKYILKT